MLTGPDAAADGVAVRGRRPIFQAGKPPRNREAQKGKRVARDLSPDGEALSA